jgi:tetratricopeptide (TPR) repeat protein
MLIRKIARYAILLSLPFSNMACEKFLDEKSDSQLVIPKTAEDLQALLDSYTKINKWGISSGQMSSDDFYVEDLSLQSMAENLRRIYTFQKDNLFPDNANDWTYAYDNVFIANVVLDNIGKIKVTGSNAATVNNIEGQALFVRSNAYFQLATTFAPVYNATTAASELGIPLRVTSDLNEAITRAYLSATFSKITEDLTAAAKLLDVTPVHVFRGSKPAAYALLARVYLYMGDYANCLKFADSSLALKNTLISFNTPAIPNLTATFPFSAATLVYKNPEILFASKMTTPAILNSTNGRVDTTLLSLYKNGDNRKVVLFKLKTAGVVPKYSFNGSYEGNNDLFDGLAVDEVYLMKAECLARSGDVTNAMKNLNLLLKQRWDKNQTYTDLTAADKNEALATVLVERRKSLVMRGLRWMDLKRFNRDGAGIAVKRIVKGVIYTLDPNDLRYALAIPEKIIFFSGIQQNKR